VWRMALHSPSSSSTSSYPFDARPLVEPVTRAEARAHTQELRRTGRLPSSATASTVIVIVVAGFILLVFGSVFVTMIGVFLSTLGEGRGLTATLFTLVPLLVIGGLVAIGIVGLLRVFGSRDERMLRLDRFAAANRMTYVPQLDAPALPGMIFSVGRSRQAFDLVRGDRPRFVEFANYKCVTGSGKNQTTHRWGYVAVRLDVPLPHIVLDALGNNALFMSNLPKTFDRDQRLRLEGDFDRHFALYCPAGYERDALYLFTPDIMARFIDNAAALDVEIVDDWLFLYAKRDFSTLDPATWAWLFSVVRALLDKLHQWSRWRDERLRAEAAVTDAATAGAVDETDPRTAGIAFTAPLDALRPPPGVAAPGRRLQTGVPWRTIVIGGAVVLFWILSRSGFFDLFGGP